MIQKRIAHCHKWINEFLQTDDAGSLKTFSTLENLVAADPSTSQPTDIESTSVEEVDADEESLEDIE
jgi:hypothetical protein